MLKAERSVICSGAAHRVRLSQEADGDVVGVAIAVAVTVSVTTTVMTEVKDGAVSTVVVSKAVTTSVTKVVEIGGNANGAEAEESEREDDIKNDAEVIGRALKKSFDRVTCEDVVSVGFESEIEAIDGVEVTGTMPEESLDTVICMEKIASVAF